MHCMEQVGFRKVTCHTVKIPKDSIALMYIKTCEPCICWSGIRDDERPVFIVVTYWIRLDRKLAHLSFLAFIPVAYTIFDIMKVATFRVIGNPGNWRSNATSEVAIHTPGEEYPTLRTH